MTFLVAFMIQILASPTTLAASTPPNPQGPVVQQLETPRPALSELAETTMSVKVAIAESALNTAKDINLLQIETNRQADKIINLEKQLSELQKPADINTATLVLACVSVGITVLGVVIAILSIFGYTNIKGEATKNAQTVARQTVEAITKAELPAETEKNIIKLLEDNRFDSIIQNAVEKVAYRGISIPDDTLENGEPN
jgi:hypothetical protein